MEEPINTPFTNTEDRISKLPDDMILQIFSFLDMKQVVQTSVLARRWKSIWISLLILSFDLNLFKSTLTGCTDPDAFTAFVNWILMVRHSNSGIQRFHLKLKTLDCSRYFDLTGRINTWIFGCLQSNVQELSFDVGLLAYQSYKFPLCLFNSKSLTKLVLKLGCMLAVEIVLPDTMDLPMLKYLKLCGLSIYQENLNAKLFLSCPVLESLNITRCNVNLNDVCVAPKLKYFKLKYNDYNVDGGDTISLHAPCLKSFICKNYMFREYNVKNLASLVTADITMMVEDEEDNSFSELSDLDKEFCTASMIRLLESLHCVRDLALSYWFLEAVSEDPQLLVDELSDHFGNLQNLKLQTFLSEESICAITQLLNISTNIESLKVIIVKDFVPNPLMYRSIDEIMFDPKADDWEQVLLLLYHLKFVMIVGVQCRINGLKFLKMLFKKAVALEKVFLYYDSVSPIVAEAFSRKLMTFPIASSSISFKWWLVTS
ncbi:F-box/FBD/LRR-repeat protein At1g16930-like isoform X1 [Papaver somniferum]|nr:F-box/FBD/LRR-repeat protein At1g16930-like isoform X1 [Papaver somniferum]XP_026410440.1 F-box/FBD/LRR-repeat protein At1g16930-like isoform X1 [Papaver somniferum]XP_026410445.1 F-box/FBD/LRR-repeat protein At1g16930-like isoform X1 [Papaver somniferum]XP_026410450.1 F-box/FBD/LRR-repeat protein At1g16930-like isoform X1 [Papaver somniferum]